MLKHYVAGACRILLEARASPDAADKPLGETPLMEAAAPSDTTIIDTLLLACFFFWMRGFEKHFSAMAGSLCRMP